MYVYNLWLKYIWNRVLCVRFFQDRGVQNATQIQPMVDFCIIVPLVSCLLLIVLIQYKLYNLCVVSIFGWVPAIFYIFAPHLISNTRFNHRLYFCINAVLRHIKIFLSFKNINLFNYWLYVTERRRLENVFKINHGLNINNVLHTPVFMQRNDLPPCFSEIFVCARYDLPPISGTTIYIIWYCI